MTDPLQQLVGHPVKSASTVHDYVQLHFGNGAVLNIYNRIETIGRWIDLPGVTLTSVTDRRPIGIQIEFANGVEILIGLSDEDFNGPEAMELIPPYGPRVVWP